MVDEALSSKIANSIRGIVQQVFPRLFAGPVVGHYGTYEYRITSQSGALVSCEPTRVDLGLPTLSRLSFRAASGLAGQHQAGTRVLVCFVNGETDEPYIAAVEGADGAGFLPTTVRLDASSEVDIGESAGTVKVGKPGGSVSVDPTASFHVGSEPAAALTVGRFIRSGDLVTLGTQTGAINLIGSGTMSRGGA
jgi:hypothetical protein